MNDETWEELKRTLSRLQAMGFEVQLVATQPAEPGRLWDSLGESLLADHKFQPPTCGVEHVDDPEVKCTYPIGHDRVNVLGSSCGRPGCCTHQYDHGNREKKYWWNTQAQPLNEDVKTPPPPGYAQMRRVPTMLERIDQLNKQLDEERISASREQVRLLNRIARLAALVRVARPVPGHAMPEAWYNARQELLEEFAKDRR